DEIERIGGQVVTQRNPGDELFEIDAQMIGDQTSTRGFHEQLHPPSPQHCRDPSTLCADLHLPPSSVRALAESAPGLVLLCAGWRGPAHRGRKRERAALMCGLNGRQTARRPLRARRSRAERAGGRGSPRSPSTLNPRTVLLITPSVIFPSVTVGASIRLSPP